MEILVSVIRVNEDIIGKKYSEVFIILLNIISFIFILKKELW